MRLLANLLFVFVIGALLCFSATANAEIIFQDDFEGHTAGVALSTVTPPIGKSYWESVSGSVGNILNETTIPPGGTSNQFVGGAAGITEVMHITTADRAASTDGLVQFDFDLYVRGNSSGYFAFEVATFTSDAYWYTGRGWNLRFGVDGNLAWYGQQGGVDGSYFAGGNDSFRRDTWVPVQVVADYSAGTFEATVDGYSFSGNFASDAGNNAFGNLATWRNIPGAGESYIDNVTIRIIPEPSSLVTLFAGLIGLLCYAWRKRR